MGAQKRLLQSCSKCFKPVLSLWWPALAAQKSQKALKTGHLATTIGQKLGGKNMFFQKFPWTFWDAVATAFSPFLIRFDVVWSFVCAHGMAKCRTREPCTGQPCGVE